MHLRRNLLLCPVLALVEPGMFGLMIGSALGGDRQHDARSG